MGGPVDLFTKFSSAKMKKQKPQCKYGDKCYRQNPQHFAEYSHGSQSESEVEIGHAKHFRIRGRGIWPFRSTALSFL